MEQFKSSKVSPYLEDKLVFIGQFCCYESGEEIAEKLMGIQISDTSINGISSKMGDQASEWIEAEDHYEVEPVKDTEQVYVQVDG